MARVSNYLWTLRQQERVVSEMEDMSAKLEKLLTEAEDCDLVGRLATDLHKRDPFKKLAVDLRTMARDVQAVISTHKPPQAVSHKIEDGSMVPKTSQ